MVANKDDFTKIDSQFKFVIDQASDVLPLESVS